MPFPRTCLTITQWVFDNDNNGKIRRAHDLDGGWEVWAKVELAMHIKRKYKPSQLLREQKIYNDIGARKRRQVDLVMTSDDSIFVPERQVLELKCQTKDETLTSFATRVLADAKKVVDQPGLYQAFNDAKVTVFAISYGSKPVDVFRVFSEKFDSLEGLYELRALDENRDVSVWMWEPLGRETTKAINSATSVGIVFPHPDVCLYNNELSGMPLAAYIVDEWNVLKAAMGGYDDYGCVG